MTTSSICRVLISGPFCTGKSTIIRRLANDFGLQKVKAISTRAMRKGETQGDPYLFISKPEFQINRDKYFDAIEFNGNYYAVLDSSLNEKRWVLDILSTSHDAYKERVPDALSIYIKPKSESLLVRRAIARGDSSDQIKQRIEALKNEVPEKFDYTVVDEDDFEAKYLAIKQIISLSSKL